MASLQHEELVELFRADALLAVELLQRSGALILPSFTRAALGGPDPPLLHPRRGSSWRAARAAAHRAPR
ncbi:MAG: hypothetical protein MUF64_33295 [Polyangiaceae bacterium]|nr:hypothetical protein [Polyangiaceae bacterium]